MTAKMPITNAATMRMRRRLFPEGRLLEDDVTRRSEPVLKLQAHNGNSKGLYSKHEDCEEVDVYSIGEWIGTKWSPKNLAFGSPKDSPFDLVAYTDSDYAGASLDRKSTTRGCQFLGCRLISWQCKKQTVVANSQNKRDNYHGDQYYYGE
ncbi:putative ribonuclease H-like domain-containing protein [Tanacetum coccineum]